VERAAGVPIAPFFRYPYLSDSPEAIAYLQGRNIGQFAIDIDSFDWQSRNADRVINTVMAGLARRGKGIVLLHDIHPSTAAAVPRLLAQIKAGGYKIVHLEPAAPVQVVAGFEPPTKEERQVPLRRQTGTRKTTAKPPSTWPWW
jgi:peptidoglycan/xylan/chitin deacetylase (PgdA/CDA1 family)